mgnify:FL=1
MRTSARSTRILFFICDRVFQAPQFPAEYREEYQQHADEFWREHGVFASDKLVGFNIGSAVVTKRWAPERFAKVADILAEKGYKPVFFGGTMDEEMVQEAVSFMKTTPVVATGCFRIGELAAAMRRCSLVITNDSGPMHVAISQKVPIVAMYGPVQSEAVRSLY